MHMQKELQLHKAILTKRLECLKEHNLSNKKIAISSKNTPTSSPSKLPELIMRVSGKQLPSKMTKNAYSSQIAKREKFDVLQLSKQHSSDNNKLLEIRLEHDYVERRKKSSDRELDDNVVQDHL